MAAKWTRANSAMSDGWEVRKMRDGSAEYRRLVIDMGKPSYSGSARRYDTIYVGHDGWVCSRTSAGYMRRHDTYEDAKQFLK